MTIFFLLSPEQGEELTDIYSMHYSQVGCSQRRDFLRQMFCFECQCQACLGEWPTFPHMPTAAGLGERLMDQLRQVQAGGDASMAKGDWGTAARLHFKLSALLDEAGLEEPHQLRVTLRNSLQCVLWKLVGI